MNFIMVLQIQRLGLKIQKILIYNLLLIKWYVLNEN